MWLHYTSMQEQKTWSLGTYWHLHWTFFWDSFPYEGDSTPRCLPSPSVFKMGTRLTGDILLGVSLWWTSTPSRGSNNTPRHPMLHAKETGISSSRLDHRSMCTITLLLNILNVILIRQISIKKSPVGSGKCTVWSLQSEVCRSSSADCEVRSLSSAFWGLQVELCSLRFTVWGLQVEFCSQWALRSTVWVPQPVDCRLTSAV